MKVEMLATEEQRTKTVKELVFQMSRQLSTRDNGDQNSIRQSDTETSCIFFNSAAYDVCSPSL